MSSSRSARLVALGQSVARENEEYAPPESPCGSIDPKSYKRFRDNVLPPILSGRQKKAKTAEGPSRNSQEERSTLPQQDLPPAIAQEKCDLPETIKTLNHTPTTILNKAGGAGDTTYSAHGSGDDSGMSNGDNLTPSAAEHSSVVEMEPALGSRDDSGMSEEDNLTPSAAVNSFAVETDSNHGSRDDSGMSEEGNNLTPSAAESEMDNLIATYSASGNAKASLPLEKTAVKPDGVDKKKSFSSDLIRETVDSNNNQGTVSTAPALDENTTITEADDIGKTSSLSSDLRQSVDSNNNKGVVSMNSSSNDQDVAKNQLPLERQKCSSLMTQEGLTTPNQADATDSNISCPTTEFLRQQLDTPDPDESTPVSDGTNSLIIPPKVSATMYTSTQIKTKKRTSSAKQSDHRIARRELFKTIPSFNDNEEIETGVTANSTVDSIPDNSCFTDGSLSDQLDNTSGTNNGQDAPVNKGIVCTTNNLIETVLTPLNIIPPCPGPQSQPNVDKQQEVVASGDSGLQLSGDIIFTNESNEVLNESELSSLNLSSDNVLIIPFANPGEDGVENPIEEPVDDMANAEAVAVQEERGDAPLLARKRNSDSWKRNQAKKLKNAGEAHISLRGHEVKAAAVGPRCGKGCRRQCQDVSHADREKIFRSYYLLCDRTAKWRFISNYVRACDIKKRTVIVHDGEEAKKNTSYEYFLPLANQSQVQVCQTMFVNTLGISTQTVKTAIKKRKDKFGLVSPCKMGKSKKKKEVDRLKDESVKKHIESFPTVESHYCRKDSTIKYIDEKLNRRKMHSMYVIECQGKNMQKNEIASLKTYRDIFKTYKLRFYKPKKDQCSRCLAWKYKSVQERTPAGAEKIRVHLAQKELSYQLKDADTKFVQLAENRKDLCVITCDLQKTMSTPKGEDGAFYYKSKFTTYNFTVFVSGEQQGYCYTWDQTTGGKGCTEVTSCMWSFIQLQVEKGVKEIRIYSDNCSAQNKNQFLFSMYVMASIRFNIKITHRYLEPGHTLLQCDAMHARIENHMKNTDVFSPSQWVTAMRMAKVNDPKYIVKVMGQEELFDFTPLAAHQRWESLGTSKFRELIVNGDEPVKVKFKFFFENDSTEAPIMKPRRGRPINWSIFPLERKYYAKFPVPAKILSGLQELCRSGSIPAEHASFYMEYLPSINQVEQEAAASEVSDVGSDDDYEIGNNSD